LRLANDARFVMQEDHIIIALDSLYNIASRMADEY